MQLKLLKILKFKTLIQVRNSLKKSRKFQSLKVKFLIMDNLVS